MTHPHLILVPGLMRNETSWAPERVRRLALLGSGIHDIKACRRCIKNSRSSLTTGRSWLRSAQAR